MNGIFQVPQPKNELVKNYEPGSEDRKKLDNEIQKMRSEVIEVPMYIGNEKVFSGEKRPMSPPHDHQHILGYYHQGNAEHVRNAIKAALKAKEKWEKMAWQDRVAIFLKAAELISGPYRHRMNAATMLAQSKNIFQSEIDAVCELVDFFRFNAYFLTQIYQNQPISAPGTWNRLDYRPLEGFVFALTPFNFTSIAGNLPTVPAMMGNVVVWKCADSQVYSARLIMEILLEAGLPQGVINLVYIDGPTAGKVIFSSSQFAGLHFTGSTSVFQNLWETIGRNIRRYRSYPRIVGETGGKDFVLAHSSADIKALSVALARGAFEYQGQKCSAASRAYIPESLWSDVKKYLEQDLKSMKMGTPEDPKNFINAVIDQRAFDKITNYIEWAKLDAQSDILFGGHYDKSQGYFIEPTVIITTNPKSKTMVEEIFGPVLTIYVYQDKDWDKVLTLIDETSPYALTGAIFSQDRYAIAEATERLQNAAGNFYINDKPTGAVVGQQPFGGARGSGTNDKAGAIFNLLRWISPRAIKETFAPPMDYRYPFLGE
jgi:1-pyrroline-5-carboxylate dehydrogenase